MEILVIGFEGDGPTMDNQVGKKARHDMKAIPVLLAVGCTGQGLGLQWCHGRSAEHRKPSALNPELR